jgi:uncharacterized protein (DUF58 family)
VAAPEPGNSARPPVKGRLRPEHAIGPIAGSVFTVLAWAAIAHNSGSGWVQALGVLLGAVLLVGLVAPGRAVKRAVVSVESNPVDAIAGEAVGLTLAASARVRVRPVSPEGVSGFFGPRGARRDGATNARPLDRTSPHGSDPAVSARDTPKLRIVPKRRGILTEVTVEVASAAPFGLLWWSQRVTLALPVEMCVAPRPTKAFTIPPEADDSGDDAAGRRSAAVGDTRSVRDYEHGDARRTVHWRASAHTGHLMVREMEMPSQEPVTVRIELPVDPVEADEIAGRGLATVLALLEKSRPVMLATHEPTGDRLGRVTGINDAGRRLARAVAHGEGPGSVTIDEPGHAPQTLQPPTFQSTTGGPR